MITQYEQLQSKCTTYYSRSQLSLDLCDLLFSRIEGFWTTYSWPCCCILLSKHVFISAAIQPFLPWVKCMVTNRHLACVFFSSDSHHSRARVASSIYFMRCTCMLSFAQCENSRIFLWNQYLVSKKNYFNNYSDRALKLPILDHCMNALKLHFITIQL